MEAFQVATAACGQGCSRIDSFFTVSEADTEHTCDPFVPGKLAESFRIGNPNQFHGLRAITDVIPMTVDEQVCCRSVNQLEALHSGPFPMICGNPFSNDSPCYRYELVINISDAKFVDF